ncbi:MULTISPECIES: hypothetical protein [unclassified Lentilitoribacter]|jgi:hypothetical protein|uniref:hypothetical protein n=1 Tax=unclassified Lentilitoribacter TaxID=2647570 RepID=UPI001575F1DA|nr:hypothetical protein [Lentilitoribacter sp. Alg239-R112]
MSIFKLLLAGFLLPGTLVLKRLGISIEEDGGVMRSFINMCFWGVVFLWIALKFYVD